MSDATIAAIVTLAVALAGGHGWGIANWARTKLGPNPEEWDWRQAGVMFLCALGVWGFAVLTGHTVADVGDILARPENAGFVAVLVMGADFVVTAGIKWWTTGDPRPAAPSTGGSS